MRYRWLGCCVLAAAPLAVQSEPGAPAGALLGYSAQGAALESEWERKFQDGISPDNIRETMQHLSARPHHVGSPYDKENAEWILGKFKQWGFDAKIETFQVLFPTPKTRVLEMLKPTSFRAQLQEPPVAGDPTSGQTSEQLPTYNAYSADGDVTAPLVYVNYGNREDYEELDRFGVSVKGAIVIARYGDGWRGVKPKVAAEHGAIGCIIYSDPKGDGYYAGDQFPAGGWRPKDGVQRGSVMDTDYPGDPLTPGVGATAKAKRLSLKEAKTITRIPVLPISYADALPLLSALAGPVAPESWRGALAITYHIGPGPAVVHLSVASNWDLKPIYDVIATLHGSRNDAEWVLRGNHHDAWVNGAEDPISGQAAMLEEARMLGELHSRGWTPERTIIYCAWDGEEPGLLGSVEWVETHLDELQKHAVAYVNSDTNKRGFLLPGGTQDLQNLISAVARDIQDPETHLSRLSAFTSLQHRKSQGCRRARGAAQTRRSGGDRAGRRIGLHRLSGLCRHFHLEPRVRERGGRNPVPLGLRRLLLVHPFRRSGLRLRTGLVADRGHRDHAIGGCRTAFRSTIRRRRTPSPNTKPSSKSCSRISRTSSRSAISNSKEGVFTAIRDPRRPLAPPPAEPIPPFMNFAPMRERDCIALKKSAERYSQVLAAFRAKGSPALPAQSLSLINADLLRVSRSFLNQKGLPDRPWFKNQIYAPGAYTGYGAKPIAAVREYMDEKKWREAEAQVPQVARAIETAAAGIDRAAEDFEAEVARAGAPESQLTPAGPPGSGCSLIYAAEI